MKEVIKKRVNLEAEIEPDLYERKLYKEKKSKVTNNVGWINFCKTVLKELRP